jgi:hypothetical protein
MESVRSIMNCIGVDTSGRVSLLFHLFGFFRERVPTDPCSSATAQVSLLDHVNSLKGRHVHLNIIRVGIDNFTSNEIDRIDYAIYRIRDIYRTVNLGVGRIEHYDVLASDANGHDDLGSEAEAVELTQDGAIPNDALDVFMVDNISDPDDWVGISPIGGPCDKDADGWIGLIGGEVNRTAEAVARTFAHEIGHYLGLEHNHEDAPDCPDTIAECDNLMAQTRCAIPPPLGTGCGNGVCQAILLIAAQGNTVRDHCSVQDGC